MAKSSDKNRRRIEAKELMDLLRRQRSERANEAHATEVMPASNPPDSDLPFQRKLTQWTSSDGKTFSPATKSVGQMTPGLYEIRFHQQIGIYFEKTSIYVDELIRFPDTGIDKVIEEVERFWEREELFRASKMCFKRGIMMWGPPGGGKTCALQLAIVDIVKRGGVVFKFMEPGLFRDGMRIFREIQPSTPVIAMMEDLDDLIRHGNEQPILQILDGTDSIDKIIYVATTNYPERLGERLINRPSRFDRIFKIGMPGEQARRMYIVSLLERGKKVGILDQKSIQVDRWIEDTEGLSFAHLRELYIGVVLLGDPYEEVIEMLKEMGQPLESNGKRAGFFEIGDPKNG